MEIRQKNYQRALDVVREATKRPPNLSASVKFSDEHYAPPLRLHKSRKLWALYADLEESLGTFETTKAVYDRMMDLKVITPQMLLNYASFLEGKQHFEDMFQAYERGVALFTYPQVATIITDYLKKFVARYGAKKLERARDLFEHAISITPAEFVKPIFYMYVKLEEEYGAIRQAMTVMDRAVTKVDDKQVRDMNDVDDHVIEEGSV